MYLIRGLCPRTDISMGAHGFAIELGREWPKLVAASGLTATMVNHKIEREGDAWLDACGYGGMYDPDAVFDPMTALDELDGGSPVKKKLGPRARRSYEARTSIRVQWGAWGLEHISVPGNACGLDIEREGFGTFMPRAAMLTPHNIDCWRQKQLLLIVFTTFAEDIVLFARREGMASAPPESD